MTDFEELTWDEARFRASDTFGNLSTEIVSLDNSLGRSLAMDATAQCDLPPYETSAMDGWVTAGLGPWKILGDVKAGLPWVGTMQAGECIRIATGAVIPDGATAVLRWESAKQEGEFIIGEVENRKDIRPAALECTVGEILIIAGVRLSPTRVGLLAAAGYDEVLVYRKPKVAFLLLGDELIQKGVPTNGLVRDSLGIQIPGLLEQFGAEISYKGYIEDELISLVDKIRDLAESFDLIITTGGTADGPRDHMHAAIAQLSGEFIVDRIKARPGHPMLLARLTNKKGEQIPLLGLPGNPQSAVVALMTLGLPIIDGFAGRSLATLALVENTESISAQPDFNRLVAGRIVEGRFLPAQHLGSAMLRGLANSTGFGIFPGGDSPVGLLIRWLPLP